MCHRHRPSLVHIMAYRLDRGRAIIWTNASILLIWPSGTNFDTISIKIHTFSLCCCLGNGCHFVCASMCPTWTHEDPFTDAYSRVFSVTIATCPVFIQLLWQVWDVLKFMGKSATCSKLCCSSKHIRFRRWITKIDSKAVWYQKSCQNMVSDIKKNMMCLRSMFEVTKKFCLVFSVSKL